MAINIDLIQRGTILRSRGNTATLGEAVKMHYMGNSRFEWGAPYVSLEWMESNARNLTPVIFGHICCEDGRELIGYGDFRGGMLEEYAAALHAVATWKHRCEERSDLPEALHLSKNLPPRITLDGNPSDLNEYVSGFTSFWWDIKNHVMMSFQSVFMEQLPKLLQNTWRCADDAEAPVLISPPVLTSTPTLYADYHGRIVRKLRNEAGVVHSLLVDIGGGMTGRLPINRLIGDPEEQSRRLLFDGDWVKVSVENINNRNGRFVLCEQEIDATCFPDAEQFLYMIELESA